MDKSNINNEGISLTICGPRITIGKFSRSVRTFFSLIQDVATDVTGKTRALEWLVSVKPGSITIEAKPESTKVPPELAAKTVSIIKDGIQAISKRIKRPEHFSDSALINLFELGNIVGLGGNGIEHVKIGIGKEYNDISPKSVAYIDEILGTESEAYGTIEGNLLALKVKDRLNFSVYETLTGKEVKCFFDDELYNDVISAIRKRVLVYGLIKYNKSGRPIRVKIEKLTPFPDDIELPKFKDIIGLFKD